MSVVVRLRGPALRCWLDTFVSAFPDRCAFGASPGRLVARLSVVLPPRTAAAEMALRRLRLSLRPLSRSVGFGSARIVIVQPQAQARDNSQWCMWAAARPHGVCLLADGCDQDRPSVQVCVVQAHGSRGNRVYCCMELVGFPLVSHSPVFGTL